VLERLSFATVKSKIVHFAGGSYVPYLPAKVFVRVFFFKLENYQSRVRKKALYLFYHCHFVLVSFLL